MAATSTKATFEQFLTTQPITAFEELIAVIKTTQANNNLVRDVLRCLQVESEVIVEVEGDNEDKTSGVTLSISTELRHRKGEYMSLPPNYRQILSACFMITLNPATLAYSEPWSLHHIISTGCK